MMGMKDQSRPATLVIKVGKSLVSNLPDFYEKLPRIAK
jgi:hypothetical protein